MLGGGSADCDACWFTCLSSADVTRNAVCVSVHASWRPWQPRVPSKGFASFAWSRVVELALPQACKLHSVIYISASSHLPDNCDLRCLKQTVYLVSSVLYYVFDLAGQDPSSTLSILTHDVHGVCDGGNICPGPAAWSVPSSDDDVRVVPAAAGELIYQGEYTVLWKSLPSVPPTSWLAPSPPPAYATLFITHASTFHGSLVKEVSWRLAVEAWWSMPSSPC